MKKNRLLCLYLTVCMLLSGCGNTAAATVQGQPQSNTSVQTVSQPLYQSEITYELPVSRARVLVDQEGYLSHRDKKVLFLGDHLSDEFRIVEEQSREVVYTGIITKTAYDEAGAQTISKGDFSDFTVEGTYYIETDGIGRSYTFSIGDQVYRDLFQALMEQEQHFTYEESPQGVINLGFGMHAMLLALQCHGSVFEENKTLVPQLLNSADWMLSVQDADTGSIYEDYEATAVFCGIMAMYHNVFGKYDEKAAKAYLDASRKSWNWMEKQKNASKQENARFYAAAQRFRIEGDTKSQNVVISYLRQHEADIMKDRFSFYGAIVYLGTERNTDRDICSGLMQKLVSETEEICISSRKDNFNVYARDISDNLHKILLICFVDYITPSNEYATVMENTIHYIEGRNEEGSRYLKKDGTWAEIEKTQNRTPEWNGILLFALSDLLDDTGD